MTPNTLALSTHVATQVAPAPIDADEVVPYRWLILLGLITAAIMEVLDTTIINVALPQMAGNLGATHGGDRVGQHLVHPRQRQSCCR